jgi:flavodoxin
MKALVVYSSKTGNTRKLAQTVYDCLICDKEIHALEDAPDPHGFDLVAMGFWLQAGKPEPKSADYMAKIGRSNVFLFATHGAAADSDHARKAMDHAKSIVASARIRGTFSCPGEVDPKILEKARAKDPQPPWLKDAPRAVGRPNEADLSALRSALKAAVGPAAG